ncbi:MAG: alpha/beta hydrolase [Deltaproteobacteria bacterium]|jgi:pimeloyl-ACP methyl ester carboxylesterase|nr:alpha/beta hydrolase [Deltaproteobacteria bacterium]
MFIKVNGARLFYEKTGAGSPLILLHGNSEDHHIFDKIAGKLANRFTVYALDSRAQGESEKTGDISYALMAEDVYSFIQELGLGQVNIIGFSDGAIIAVLLGLKRLEVLNRVALLGLNLNPQDFTDEGREIVKSIIAKDDSPVLALMLKEPDIQLASLAEIKVPALVVAGENDIFKPKIFPAIAKALPQAELKIIKGHDHMSYIVDNDMLYDDFVQFFS